ncbi:MAG TPA: prepilin-type N-terminal cleavage/methylation domain-containing protein [Chitinispirillaceae bacterium]|nr:prepilin-type N-terminal cleavage/methylation domain-containing protein [Chitinispirillaceae bacterium]
MNRNGVTLIELLVYVVLFSVVSLFVGSQMKQLLGGYTSERRISRLQSESRDVLAMLSREIRNTGLKTSLISSGPGSFSTVIDPWAYLPDSSSFMHKEGNPGDTLTIYKLRFDDNGESKGVDTIQYYLDVNEKVLKRNSGGQRIDVAENIHALQFQYGVIAIDSLLLDQKTINPNDWSVAVGATKSGAMKVSVPSSVTSGSITCNTTFRISKAQRIRARFQILGSGNFPANLDRIDCCIRNSETNTIIANERFLPNGSEFNIVMPVPATSSAVFSFDYLCHGSGDLEISSVEVRRVDIGEYKWEYDPVISQKKAVKAIRIFALVRSSGKAAAASNQNITIANIPFETSGPYVWRVVKETIEVLNNGAF